MKICENGVVRRMTTEEVRIHNEQMQANEEITPEERIEALEETVRLLDEQLAATKVLLGVE